MIPGEIFAGQVAGKNREWERIPQRIGEDERRGRKERATEKFSLQQYSLPRSKTTYDILRVLELCANHRAHRHNGGRPVTVILVIA